MTKIKKKETQNFKYLHGKVKKRDPTKWWLISDEDVQAIKKGLEGSLLHTLKSGLHVTNEVPEDWRKIE